MSTPPPDLDYPALLRRALRGLVREVLERIGRDGLPPGREVFVALDTRHPGVELPAAVRDQYPEEITLVLRERFYSGLAVDGGAFRVSLQFGAIPARVVAPFAAVVRIADPAASFGLEIGPPDAVRDAAPEPGAGAGAPAAPGGNVVSFDRRRFDP